MRKIPYAGIELTSQRVRGLRGTSELTGRPASRKIKQKSKDIIERGVFSGAAMTLPALHLRENTRGRRQGRRHDPLGRTIGGLDQQQRANGSQNNADDDDEEMIIAVMLCLCMMAAATTAV